MSWKEHLLLFFMISVVIHRLWTSACMAKLDTVPQASIQEWPILMFCATESDDAQDLQLTRHSRSWRFVHRDD